MLGLMSVPALAQETYQNTKMAENSLTGTARYVGMGGAMEALGADISTMSSNPAGIGLFRKSQVSMTFGVVAQTDAETALNYNGSTLSFDGKNQNLVLIKQVLYGRLAVKAAIILIWALIIIKVQILIKYLLP